MSLGPAPLAPRVASLSSPLCRSSAIGPRSGRHFRYRPKKKPPGLAAQGAGRRARCGARRQVRSRPVTNTCTRMIRPMFPNNSPGVKDESRIGPGPGGSSVDRCGKTSESVTGLSAPGDGRCRCYARRRAAEPERGAVRIGFDPGEGDDGATNPACDDPAGPRRRRPRRCGGAGAIARRAPVRFGPRPGRPHRQLRRLAGGSDGAGPEPVGGLITDPGPPADGPDHGRRRSRNSPGVPVVQDEDRPAHAGRHCRRREALMPWNRPKIIVALAVTAVLVGGVATGRHLLAGGPRRRPPAGARPGRRRPPPRFGRRNLDRCRRRPSAPPRREHRTRSPAAAGSRHASPLGPSSAGSDRGNVPVFAVTPQVVHTATIDLRVGKGKLDPVLALGRHRWPAPTAATWTARRCRGERPGGHPSPAPS